jgi:hypothetical protein
MEALRAKHAGEAEQKDRIHAAELSARERILADARAKRNQGM